MIICLTSPGSCRCSVLCWELGQTLGPDPRWSSLGGPRGGCDGHDDDQLLDSVGEVVAHAYVVGGVACMHVGGVEFC